MIETFDPGAVHPRSSRKHRRLDDILLDGGGDTRSVGPLPPSSYKESLMKDTESTLHDADAIFDDDDVEILEGDVTRSLVDGIISIDFSDRVRSLAEKSLDQTLVVKLLGRRIGYTTMSTKIYEIWESQQALRLMDIENDYFLITFKLRSDYLKVLAGGPWTIFGHYLTVQQWSPEFSTATSHPTQVMVWISLPGLPVPLYKKSLIEEIGESIGHVIKLDYQMEWGRRGRFARLAISIDLSKPLVSKIMVNGKIQLIEYESLPLICFHCGRYGHAQESCPVLFPTPISVDPLMEQGPVNQSKVSHIVPTVATNQDDGVVGSFGPWMLWKARNDLVFNGIPPDAGNTLQCSMLWARYYNECVPIAAPVRHVQSNPLHWQRPLAELWGILLGLQLAWKNGFERILIQSDNREAIKRVSATKASSDPCSRVRSIAALRCRGWATKI
ncbi:hypothetical protein V6N12_054137 [Hibiscus sabdariffa]|uniref:CCHC-type domain-containing protein n=1 Tax=Hibiscus sabdariffa TaxID=183260 RepID=A0ABR2B7I1_9ROSI